MFTSDKKTAKQHLKKIHREGLLHLMAALFLALFGAVYEHFSHGVFSYYMIYAFLIPLAPGAALYLWIAAATWKKLERAQDPAFPNETADDAYKDKVLPADAEKPGADLICLPGSFSLRTWDYGIAVLAVGSVFQGVLEIYGTTNRLSIIYPVAGTAFLFTGLISFLAPFLTVRRMQRRYA